MTKSEFDTQDIKTIDLFVSKAPDYFAMTQKIYDKVFGNGNIGMDEQLRNVQKSLDEITRLLNEADVKGTRQRVDLLLKLAWAVSGAALTYLVVELLKLI